MGVMSGAGLPSPAGLVRLCGDLVPQIDQRERDVVGTQKTSLVLFKTNKQAFELVHPGKGMFAPETVLVDLGIEAALPAPFRTLPIARILRDIRNQAVIEARFAGITGIKSFVGIEISALNLQSQLFHLFEGALQMFLELVSVIVVPSDDADTGHYIVPLIHNRQDVAGLTFLAMLIGNRFTAFLCQGMTAI